MRVLHLQVGRAENDIHATKRFLRMRMHSATIHETSTWRNQPWIDETS